MRKQTVVVLGSTGMAGSMIYRYLSRVNQVSGHTLYTLYGAARVHKDADIYNTGVHMGLPSDPHKIVKKVMKELKPDIIINCIGMSMWWLVLCLLITIIALTIISSIMPDNTVFDCFVELCVCVLVSRTQTVMH